MVLFKPLTSDSNHTRGCHSNHSPGHKPYGKSGGVIQTTNFRLGPHGFHSNHSPELKPYGKFGCVIQTTQFRLKPYAWVSLAKIQAIREIRWRYSTTHPKIKPYAWVSFKPFTSTQTIPQIPLVLFKPYLFIPNHSHQNFIS